MTNLKVTAAVIGVFALGVVGALLLKSHEIDLTPATVSVSPTDALLGGDKDAHGCIPSAGYSWCEAKQKCLRAWEEKCETPSDGQVANETAVLKVEIHKQLVAKHGPNAASLTISVSQIVDDYAKGGASEPGVGGGMWFAAKVDGNWELIWDGNGIITCTDISDFPDFPTSMIPECYNTSTQSMIKR